MEGDSEDLPNCTSSLHRALVPLLLCSFLIVSSGLLMGLVMLIRENEGSALFTQGYTTHVGAWWRHATAQQGHSAPWQPDRPFSTPPHSTHTFHRSSGQVRPHSPGPEGSAAWEQPLHSCAGHRAVGPEQHFSWQLYF